MAIGRLSVGVGSKGKASPHAQYIAREGKYAKPSNHQEKLEHTGHGNMPAWAEHNPSYFWQMADEYERSNGSTYREHVIALPRELDSDQRHDLIKDWIEREIGDKHAYQYAIHNPPAMDGGEQPHAHIMFSERTIDGIERDPDQYFKRYNSKNPEKGGAKKANTGMKPADRRVELKAQRDRWEKICNAHLERAGYSERISMKSLKEQGIEREPLSFTMAQMNNPQSEAFRTYVLMLEMKEDSLDAERETLMVFDDGGVEEELRRQLYQIETEKEAKQKERKSQLEAHKRAIERKSILSSSNVPPNPKKEYVEQNRAPVIDGQTVKEALEEYNYYDKLVAMTSEKMREHDTKQVDAKMIGLAKKYRELEDSMPLLFKGKHQEKMQEVARQHREAKRDKKHYQNKDYTMDAKNYIENKHPQVHARYEKASNTLHAQASFKYGAREAQAGRIYTGKITAVNRLGIKQKLVTGKTIYHKLDSFDNLPNEGDKLTIRYDANEKATVMEANKLELERQNDQKIEKQYDRGFER